MLRNLQRLQEMQKEKMQNLQNLPNLRNPPGPGGRVGSKQCVVEQFRCAAFTGSLILFVGRLISAALP